MYEFFVSKHFKKQIKKYIKKHRSLLDDVVFFLGSCDPSAHIKLGFNLYKARLNLSDLNKGKSNSFRIIILFVQKESLLAPITMYYKGDIESISKQEIKQHVQQVEIELEEFLE